MTVATDKPITKASEDRFGRREFAARIARVILSLEDSSSIVISVNAPWGEGKTSVLNMIEEKLGDAENALVMRFNPWRFSDEEQLLKKYFKALSSKLGKSLNRGKEIAKVIKAYSDAITPLAEITVPIGGKILGETFKSLSGRFAEASDLEELKEKIEKYLREEQRRIIVFMDDIDRLNRQEIQAVLRLVKLTADFPWTAYVLAFDDEKVSASLAEQFEGQEAGRSFLEKIVQVPLPVPPADPQILRRMVFEGVESALKLVEVELTREEAGQFVAVFDRSFSRMLFSPRAVKRYINMLNFALPILKDEVNMLDLTLIEGVRAFFPKLYETIRAEFGVFLKDSLEYLLSIDKSHVKTRFGKLMGESLTGYTETERDGALFVLQVLFPNIREYGFTAAGHYVTHNDEDWEKRKRICASRYFRRYFNYGIPPNDISDKEVEQFIDSLGEADIEQLMNRLETLSADNRSDILIQKLTMYEDKVAPNCADKLAIAIARRSDLIRESHPDDNILGLGSLARAAFLLRQLISQVEDTARRENTAKDVAKHIERLPFAYEFQQIIRKFRKERGSEEFVEVVSSQCEREIGHIFAEKLARAAESKPLEDSYPQLKRSFYIAWRWCNQESLRQYAQRRLQEHPEDVSKFLSAVLGANNNKDSDFIPIPEPDAEYQFLADIIHPDEMMNFIRRCYSATNTSNVPRAVRWFVQMYEKAISRSSTE
jgi:predicted KAP-like P-loop ATPase